MNPEAKGELHHGRRRFPISLDDHTRRLRAEHAGVEQRGQARFWVRLPQSSCGSRP